MLIQILVDNPASWIVPYANELRSKLVEKGHTSLLLHNAAEVKKGDILCLLGCEKVFKNLKLNLHNLVVHESKLPQGKGWSPLTWQVIEGKKEIPVTLFEADDEVDSGVIYYQETIKLEGTELIDELRQLQGSATIQLIMKFISNYNNLQGNVQVGESSYYKRRKPEDSELNIDKTIKEQINLLRVVDNNKYPAFFVYEGVKYILTIKKAEN